MSTITSNIKNRYLDQYPQKGPRVWYLALTVVATIAIYYEVNVIGTVIPLIMDDFNMSAAGYAYLWVAVNAIGALSSLIGGFADRVGRSNFVIYGLGISALLTLLLIFPNTLTQFYIVFIILGFVEGTLLAVTPALIRDFSPRMGRATAMAFWLIGPVGGSLLTTFIASQTLSTFGTWQSQFIIASIIGALVFLVSLLFLKELPPSIRNQILVSEEQALNTTTKENNDSFKTVEHGSWKQIFRSKVLLSAFGISVFLFIYYTSVSYFPLFLNTIFDFSLDQANSMMSVYWLVTIITVILIGIISDRTEVRKPYMIVGSIGMIIGLLILTLQIGKPINMGMMTLLLSIIAAMTVVVWATWMASYTETLEDINPAYVATGMAIYSSVQRVVITGQQLWISQHIGTPEGYKTWFMICIGAVIILFFTVFIMGGYWTTKKAKESRKALELDFNKSSII